MGFDFRCMFLCDGIIVFSDDITGYSLFGSFVTLLCFSLSLRFSQCWCIVCVCRLMAFCQGSRFVWSS